MSKQIKKEITEIFTIQFNQMNDSTEIPGIAQLLGSQTGETKKTEKKPEAAPANTGVKFTTKAEKKPLQSLNEFGTCLEVHFTLKENIFLYSKYEDFSSGKFPGSDALFKGMKFSVAFMKDRPAFCEFQKKEQEFLFDAFGIFEQNFLQFVLNQSNQMLTVYVSEKSMQAKKEDVIAYTEEKNSSQTSSGIELDVA